MNERQAEREGLHFTGIYSFDKEETKKRITEERQKYPKARIIMVGPKGGYSAYADEMYSALKFIKECENIHVHHEIALKILKEEYNKKLENCKCGYISRIEKLNEALKFAGFKYTVTPRIAS